MTVSSIFSVLWVDQKECKASETPLTCELRVNRPMFAIISFGTNDAYSSVNFDKVMRRAIETTIGNGTVPILATKADNAEHDYSINREIANLAYEYELPLWNFWAAVQPLPYHGMSVQFLQHLSAGTSNDTNFNFTGDNLKYGWTVRNLTPFKCLMLCAKQSRPYRNRGRRSKSCSAFFLDGKNPSLQCCDGWVAWARVSALANARSMCGDKLDWTIGL